MGFLPDEFLESVEHNQNGKEGEEDAKVFGSSGRESVERSEDGEGAEDREGREEGLPQGPAGSGSESGGLVEGPEGRPPVQLTSLVSISHESGKPPGILFQAESEKAQDLVVRGLAGFVSQPKGDNA
jgi:hypothetical protein